MRPWSLQFWSGISLLTLTAQYLPECLPAENSHAGRSDHARRNHTSAPPFWQTTLSTSWPLFQSPECPHPAPVFQVLAASRTLGEHGVSIRRCARLHAGHLGLHGEKVIGGKVCQRLVQRGFLLPERRRLSYSKHFCFEDAFRFMDGLIPASFSTAIGQLLACGEKLPGTVDTILPAGHSTEPVQSRLLRSLTWLVVKKNGRRLQPCCAASEW